MDKSRKKELWEVYKTLGQDALALNHYDLAKLTDVDPELWKDFLSAQDVKDWINTEFAIIRDSELKKMTKGISTSNSVGQAQLMNALAKQMETGSGKSGPAFIYCYVPLNVEQASAPNLEVLEHDVFLKEK